MAGRAALRLVAALGTLALGVVVPSAAATAATTHGPRDRVVVIGTAGMTWADVDAMPALSAFLEAHADEVAPGNLVVRSIRTTACPADGWLALSAGTRASSRPDGDAPCTPLPAVAGGPASVVPGWQDYVAAAAAQSFDARLGALGDVVERSGVAASAVGAGAAVALATSEGTVAGEVVDGSATTDAAGLAEAVRRTADDRLTVVDVGTDDQGLGALDDRLVAALDAIVADDPSLARTTVVVASLADAPGAKEAALQAALVLGEGTGLLTSTSTRTDGLVLTTDVPATVTAALGLDSAGGIGAPIATTAADSPWDLAAARTGLVDDGDRASAAQDLSAATRAVTALLVALGVLSVTFLARLRRERGVVRLGNLWLASLPVAATLANAVPWWRAGVPALAYTAVALLAATAVAGVAVGVARRLRGHGSATRERLRALAAPLTVAAVTWLVLAVDVARGAPWQLASPMGTLPQLAGRFYGMNNTAFAFFAVATLALVGGLGWVLARHRQDGAPFPRVAGLPPAWAPRVAVAALSVVGIGSLAVDGLPSLGADLGGPVALVPGLAMLLLAASGVTVRARHWVATGVVAVAVVVAAAAADWARGPQRRTHLGDFVQDVLDGGGRDVLGRKLEGAFGVVTSGWPAAVGSVVVVAVLWVVAAAWRRQVPGLAARSNALWVWAVPVTLVGAALVNDSGPSIPALGLLMAAPLMLAWDAGRRAA